MRLERMDVVGISRYFIVTSNTFGNTVNIVWLDWLELHQVKGFYVG